MTAGRRELVLTNPGSLHSDLLPLLGPEALPAAPPGRPLDFFLPSGFLDHGLALFRLGLPERDWRSLLPPISLIPCALPTIACIAEHLEICLIQGQSGKECSRLDMIDVNPNIWRACTTAFTTIPALLEHDYAQRQPRTRRVERLSSLLPSDAFFASGWRSFVTRRESGRFDCVGRCCLGRIASQERPEHL